MSGLADRTATELLALYRAGSASPVEATRAVLARIEAVNPLVNAFCLVDAERAHADARASEARWRSGTASGALDGVPVSIKDIILTKGWPTRRGSRTVDPRQPWDEDAPVTARLREAGAVLLGKTTSPEFGIKGTTDNTLTGVTRNPWNLAKTSGGSSGGAAAAVACGLGPLAVGTDGAGSIRIPSAFCGVPGLKPSFGRVPAWPLSPYGSVAHLGPHARTVEDLARVLAVMARPDARDWTSLPYEDRDYAAGLDAGVKGLRVAFSPDLGYVRDVDPEVAASVRDAARAFEALGAHVEEIAPGLDDPREIASKLWFSTSTMLFDRLTPAQQALVDPALAWQANEGRKVTLAEYQQLVLRRVELGTRLRRFHERFDLLLTPGMPHPAHDAKASNEWRPEDADFFAWTPFTFPFNLSRQPAAVVPCGLTQAGLPIALQVVGPMYRDDLVLRAARAYEGTREWKLPVAPKPR